jgi:hypothetical protein
VERSKSWPLTRANDTKPMAKIEKASTNNCRQINFLPITRTLIANGVVKWGQTPFKGQQLKVVKWGQTPFKGQQLKIRGGVRLSFVTADLAVFNS